MTASARETLLDALKDWLETPAAPATVQRSDGIPSAIPADGLVDFDDGDPGEPDYLMGTATPYGWEHAVTLDLIAPQDLSASAQRSLADAIGARIGAAILADRTLGGLVDWCEIGAPKVDRIPVEGGDPVHILTVTLTLVYSTASPLT